MSVPIVRLKLRVKLPDGNRAYVEPVFSSNGKLKPLYGVVGGKPRHHPEGIYNLRYFKNGKRVWEPVGTLPVTQFVMELSTDVVHQQSGLSYQPLPQGKCRFDAPL